MIVNSLQAKATIAIVLPRRRATRPARAHGHRPEGSGVPEFSPLPAHGPILRVGERPQSLETSVADGPDVDEGYIDRDASLSRRGEYVERAAAPLAHEVRRHLPTPMCGQAIPDEGEALPRKVAVEILQEGHQGVGVVTAGTGLEEQATPLAVPPEREGDTDRQLRPVVGMDQDGRLAAGRPRAPDRRALGDSALVLKDESGASAPSVFLPRANAWTASGESPPHCAPWLGARVVAASTPACPTRATHAPGDSARQSGAR